MEIFSSIQGEGLYAGVRQVFVRFFECNMHCIWCDTPHSIGDTARHFQEYTLDEVCRRIEESGAGCHSVSLTGGEPLLQKDFLKTLSPSLKKMGLPSYLETNGTLYSELAEIIDEVDIIAMDMKLPSSTQCRAYWEEHAQFLKTALKKEVFVKTVISSQTQPDDIDHCSALIAGINPDVLLILQPNSFDLGSGVVRKCLEFQNHCQKRLKHVRILPQIHRYLKLR